MNYRNIALRGLKEYADEFPEYALGQILYSVVRKEVTDCNSIKSLRDLTDEQVYSIIDKARETERE